VASSVHGGEEGRDGAELTHCGGEGRGGLRAMAPSGRRTSRPCRCGQEERVAVGAGDAGGENGRG